MVMDPAERCSSQLLEVPYDMRVLSLFSPSRSSESTSLRKSLRCWFGSSDRSPWNELPFCTNRMVSDRRGTTLSPTRSLMETPEDCARCDKQWKNPTSTISDQSIANLKAQLVGNEMVRVKIPREVPSFDEPKPLPQPLPNCLSLDVILDKESLEALWIFTWTILG
ncbi:hypothetical protein Tco_1055197 [Tanacetum coccineum]|uniref:Uncharacterized protein n=1 Tax=Tanacetum coccineum TaxID=301880 RepID=A0ABQ5GYX1_9ASTR